MGAAAWGALAACLLAAALAVHQAGHAVACAELGIPHTRTRFGAVRPDITPEQAAAMTYRQAAWWTCAGPIANLVAGAAMLAAWWFFTGKLLAALAAAVVAAAGWAFRHAVALALVPVAGLAVLVTQIWGLAAGLRVDRATIAQVLIARSFTGALLAAAAMSLAVALFTMLPVSPLDGHRMMLATARAWTGRPAAIYMRLSVWVIAAVIGAAILTDVLALLAA